MTFRKLFVTSLSLAFVEQCQAIDQLAADWFLKDEFIVNETASAEDLLASFKDAAIAYKPVAEPVKLLGDRFDWRHYNDN